MDNGLCKIREGSYYSQEWNCGTQTNSKGTEGIGKNFIGVTTVWVKMIKENVDGKLWRSGTLVNFFSTDWINVA